MRWTWIPATRGRALRSSESTRRPMSIEAGGDAGWRSAPRSWWRLAPPFSSSAGDGGEAESSGLPRRLLQRTFQANERWAHDVGQVALLTQAACDGTRTLRVT